MNDFKKLLLGALTFLTVMTASAVSTVKKPMPRVAEDDKVLSLPGRFYYFAGDDLHCYDTKVGTDTTIDEYFGGPYHTIGKWYDAATDCVYLIQNDGGNAVDGVTVFQLTNKNLLTPMIYLTGGVGEVTVKPTEDYVFMEGFVDSDEPVNIPGVKKGEPITKFFSHGLKPWTFSRNSLNVLKRPKVNFYGVTTPGVNVRTYGDSKAPRVGYFKTRPGYEEEGGYLQGEDDAIDTQVFTRSFTPWHPEIGTVFASNPEAYVPDGWTNIIVNDLTYQPVVSSKFLVPLQNEPLTRMDQFNPGDLKNRVYKMNSTKYPGLWLLIGELPDCGEAPLYLGKEVDGLVVFKWQAGWPVSSGEATKRISTDESGYVYYGTPLTKNEYELDLSKITDSDIDALLKVIKPVNGSITTLVKIPELGIGEFELPASMF